MLQNSLGMMSFIVILVLYAVIVWIRLPEHPRTSSSEPDQNLQESYALLEIFISLGSHQVALRFLGFKVAVQ